MSTNNCARKLALLESVLRNLPQNVAIAITDASLKYIDDFPAWRRLYGLKDTSLKGMSHYDVFPDLPGEWIDQHRELLTHGVCFEEHDGTWFKRPDGKRECITYGICPWFKDDGSIGGMTMVSTVVTRMKTLEEQLALDSLTCLPNRGNGYEQMQLAIDALHRDGRRAAIVFVDLNGFKAINDRIDHQAGDVVLRQIARRLASIVQSPDLVCRQGGDEFLVMQFDSDIEKARDLCERLISGICTPIDIGLQTVSVGASLGVVMSAIDQGGGDNLDQLIYFADLAMFKAKEKKSEGSRYCIFDERMLYEYEEDSALTAEIVEAFKRNEFVMHYQPLLDLKTGRIAGFEGLARWRNKLLGLVFPDRFLPFIEKLGLHQDLCEWALTTAAKQALEWQKIDPSIKVSCNVEPQEIRSGFVIECVNKISEEMAINDLRIEISERSIDLIGRRIAETCLMTSLTFLIDDFGSGKANFFVVAELARNADLIEIKLDKQALSQSKNADSAWEGMLASIVGFAKSLSLPITGEGVETQEQLDLLKRLGFDYAQGYLIGKPMPAKKARQFLVENLKMFD